MWELSPHARMIRYKEIIVIHLINGMKGKNHMIVSKDAEKHLMQHLSR